MPVEQLEFDMVNKKIENFQNRWYITSGIFISLTNFFHVPKGGSDIRLVYDLSTCVINMFMWGLKFCMTSV